MGQWDFLIPEVERKIGRPLDHEEVARVLDEARHELEMLAGRTFHPVKQQRSVIETCGLPFADIPGLLIGPTASLGGAWAIPDPVDPARANILQLATFPDSDLVPRAAREAEALWAAGHVVAQAYREGCLYGEFVLRQLANLPPQDGSELLLRVRDPAFRLNVPIATAIFDGWLIQITRRLVFGTPEIEDEGRLLEFLDTSEDRLPLMAVEPVLIMAPLTHQPVRWAFAARLWTEMVQVPANPLWSRIASAIHNTGVPTITLDPLSSPQEIACQLVLKAYWHNYIKGDEPVLAEAVAEAYPQAVEHIQRGMRTPTSQSAAATLLEGLIRPGFNPQQGAEATRRYVRRKARIAVMEHRKREEPQRYPWTRVGISERRFYKLLPEFAEKVNGRYDYDQDDVVTRMKDHIDQLEKDREMRAAAMEVLVSNGFSPEAARKWLQRHQLIDALTARPRQA